LLHLRVVKFNDPSTAFTDNVVVVALFLQFFKARLPVGEVPLRCETTFLEQFQGAIDRRVPYPWVDLPDITIELLNADMTFRREEDLGDIFSLRSRL
jgi:hypothetical protein